MKAVSRTYSRAQKVFSEEQKDELKKTAKKIVMLKLVDHLLEKMAPTTGPSNPEGGEFGDDDFASGMTSDQTGSTSEQPQLPSEFGMLSRLQNQTSSWGLNEFQNHEPQ